MSYCRFSEGDVYLFPISSGGIECCTCRLTPRNVETIFTKGIDEGNPSFSFWGKITPCEKCGGKGCSGCMMNNDVHFDTHAEAIAHLEEHRAAGHVVPEYAFERLRQEMKAADQPADGKGEDGGP
jgi:hypothetical protein